MKTKGISCAGALKLLFIICLASSAHVSAQLNFSFQNSNSFGVPGKPLLAGLMNDLAFEVPANKSEPLISTSLFSFSATNTAGETSHSLKQGYKNILPLAINSTKTPSGRLAISFKATSFNYPQDSRTEKGIAEYSATQLLYYAKALKQYAKKTASTPRMPFSATWECLAVKKDSSW